MFFNRFGRRFGFRLRLFFGCFYFFFSRFLGGFGLRFGLFIGRFRSRFGLFFGLGLFRLRRGPFFYDGGFLLSFWLFGLGLRCFLGGWGLGLRRFGLGLGLSFGLFFLGFGGSFRCDSIGLCEELDLTALDGLSHGLERLTPPVYAK